VSPLPPFDSDRKTIARVDLLTAAGDTITVLATHFGLAEPEQVTQLRALLETLPADAAAVLVGDLNASDGSAVARALHAAGFRDAFELADRAPAPTAPAARPTNRIDWIWLRGYTAEDAAVSDGPGSDHRLVVAAIRAGAPNETAGRNGTR
jgi:endonuclease/exonuclease/phosphatase family metal-dependent hydrolase